MTLPIDLVLVRHGESEGNAAKRLSETGDDRGVRELEKRHTASFRLTERGRRQAIQAGKWLREEFGESKPFFDRCVTSEYFRAMETAGLLDLPFAEWLSDFYITERDWGVLETFSDTDRNGKFADELERRDVEPFFWRPTRGESFAELCLRVDRVLQTLHRECGEQKVIIVCHGEVMRAFQVRIERLSQVAFKKLHFSQNPKEWVFNGQIDHYTRRNPKTGEVASNVNWVRIIRPTESPPWKSDWREIVRPRYSNEDLLTIVETVQPVLR
ncbi:MAG: hypothetical protein A2494_01285 [Candidatus Lloydbacteria bacterium RIFOXYC12_FULL_46_25]|uniref:phosphoglycerate mutase (2,3-diphosphoglycerate-dependent) n=1 Tax=Candidatus Lloydbacteria bacterium RIFOXYC12_FULL_46_25 TaxID=1798670 RepID=A0A1G2E0I5_9BACT|nr:MAG: hypothetical protein A2494_01285 [Candidatus Lloydbacteria bacterium RIFOXYC12_FULL_46_25]